MVTVVEISLGDSARATGAFRYILTGHFKVHASGMRPFSLMVHQLSLKNTSEPAVARAGETQSR